MVGLSGASLALKYQAGGPGNPSPTPPRGFFGGRPTGRAHPLPRPQFQAILPTRCRSGRRSRGVLHRQETEVPHLMRIKLIIVRRITAIVETLHADVSEAHRDA